MTTQKKKEMVESLMNPLTEQGVEKLAKILLLEAMKTKSEKQIIALMSKVLF